VAAAIAWKNLLLDPSNDLSAWVFRRPLGLQSVYLRDGVPSHRPRRKAHAVHDEHPHAARLGVTTDGAFAHFMVAPERNVFPIGDLSFQDGALIEPLACVAWGLKRVQVQPGDHAIVFGAGPMGCLLMQAVKGSGASSVTVVDRSPERLEMATRLGADHAFEADGLTPEATRSAAPHGFEVVADATGIPKVMEDAIAYARPAGTL
jgi:threonine dehydrogenase-like Zn-dependent dehydrogenase